MTAKEIIVISICVLVTGCASIPDQCMQPSRPDTTEARHQIIDVYDKQGNTKEHVIGV